MNDDDDRPRKKRRPDDEDDRPRRHEPDDEDDIDDDRPRKRRSSGGSNALETVVPFKNGAALAAYYCGVFGLIPGIGLLLGPIAFILGIVGLVKKKNNPKVKGTGHALAGIILGIVDLAIWPVLWYTVFEPATR